MLEEPPKLQGNVELPKTFWGGSFEIRLESDQPRCENVLVCAVVRKPTSATMDESLRVGGGGLEIDKAYLNEVFNLLWTKNTQIMFQLVVPLGKRCRL